MANFKLLINRRAVTVLIFLVLWASTGFGQISSYILEWNGHRINFRMVSGLGESTQTSIIPNRTQLRTSTLTAGNMKTVTLQKVQCSLDNELYKWFCSYSEPTRQKRDINIKLLNLNGEIIKVWKIYQASPSKMDVPPTMNAEANDVFIETLVLTYEKVEPDLFK